MEELKLDLKGFTARQYAALIIKEELGLTHGLSYYRWTTRM